MMRKSRLYGWWYGAISTGFLLLALQYGVRHAAWWEVALRLFIAIGFALLSYAAWRAKE